MYQLRRTTITTVVHMSLPLLYCFGLSYLDQTFSVVCYIRCLGNIIIVSGWSIDKCFSVDSAGSSAVDNSTSSLSGRDHNCTLLVSS